MDGYNDDLVMSYSLALWVRDTALRLQSDKNDHQLSLMNSMLDSNGNVEHDTGFSNRAPINNQYNPWKWDSGGDDEQDLTWLIG